MYCDYFFRKEKNTMLEKIIEIFASQLQIDSASVNADTLILEDLGADSLVIIEILTEIEDTFDISILDEDIPSFKTVGDIAKYIEERK